MCNLYTESRFCLFFSIDFFQMNFCSTFFHIAGMFFPSEDIQTSKNSPKDWMESNLDFLETDKEFVAIFNSIFPTLDASSVSVFFTADDGIFCDCNRLILSLFAFFFCC